MGTESYTQNCKAKVGVSVSQKVGERVAVERVKPARVLTIFLVARIAREVAAHDGVGTLESTVLVIVQANEDLKACGARRCKRHVARVFGVGRGAPSQRWSSLK